MDTTAADEVRVETGKRGGLTPHGAAQREALVRAAYDLIAERGFEGLRTRDIAARAGVNIATLHYYFKTKEDLIRSVVDALVERFSTRKTPTSDTPDAPDAPDAQPMNPLTQLRQELLDVQYQVSQFPEMFIVLIELFMRAQRDPAIKAIMRDMDIHWREYIASYLRDGVELHIFRRDLDVGAAAAGLAALVKGVAIELMTDPDSFPAARLNVEMERWLTDCKAAEPT